MGLLQQTLAANKLIDPNIARDNRVTPAIAHVNAGIMGHGVDPLESIESFQKTYATITWVYAGVSAIQDNIAKLPIRIYDRPATEDDRIEITDNPKFKLFEKPNPFSSRYLFWATVVGSLELTGELFVNLVRGNENQPPQAMIPLRSDRISIVPDPKEYIGGYVYKIGGIEIPFQPWEIFHVAYYNPIDDYRGQSPLQAGRNAQILELHSVNWAKDFFKSGTRAAGMLTIDGKIDQEQFKRLEKQFSEKYIGRQKTMILEQGMDFTQTSVAPKDADFSGLRDMNRTGVCAGVG
ncbi:hypothetical protein LCGC14_2163920 [marine sediment metagenome]|uniref:Phage portal protein n=1 Tax=marine sediment metagenome TaxID=412755 RepID=A0A0F9DS09_9ZZZZ